MSEIYLSHLNKDAITTAGIVLSLLVYLVHVKEAYAQNFPDPPGFGIPVTLVAAILVILVLTLAIDIKIVKTQRHRLIIGIAAISSAFLAIAAATPVDMHSFYAGSRISFCENNPCNNLRDIESYDELGHSFPSTLRKAIDAARVEGQGNCCGIRSINYFEELSMLPFLYLSTINAGVEYSYSNWHLFKFMGEYYEVSFHHVDVDSTYTYQDTTFTIDAIFGVITAAIAFFSAVISKGTTGVVHSKTSAEHEGLKRGRRRIIEWVAARRFEIPVISIALYLVMFTMSIGLHYSSYHLSSYAIVIGAVFSLLLYMTIIAAARFSIRRTLK